jgi:hypothetical protein
MVILEFYCILHLPWGRAGSSVAAVIAVATSSLLLSKGLNLRLQSVFITGLFGGGARVGTASPVDMCSVATASLFFGLVTTEKNDKFWSIDKWKEYAPIKLDIHYYAFD